MADTDPKTPAAGADQRPPREKRDARRPALPWQIRLLQAGFRYLGPVMTGLFVGRAWKLWFMTRRFPVPAREQRWLASARTEWLETASHGRLPLYHWEGSPGDAGPRPRILLVHGWNGRATQMGAFVAPLLEAGFRVTAFDGPGHGETPGRNTTNVLRFSEATAEVARYLGPLHGIVGHSFGVIVTVYALSHLGVQAGRVVCLSSPAHMEDLVQNFYRRLHIPPSVQQLFERRVHEEFGEDIWRRISPEEIAPTLAHIPALLIHDEDDLDVPLAQSERVHRAWPGSVLQRTRRLGHRRILRNKKVAKDVADFMRAGK